MSRKRKNAGEGYGFMFSGAFSEKKDAVAKEKKRKGSFVKGMPTKHGYRYVVMTPRTNPPKRRRKNYESGYFSERHGDGSLGIVVWANTSAGPFHVQPYVNNWDTATHEVGKYKTLEMARKKARAYLERQGKYKRGNSVAWGKGSYAPRVPNPSELLVMGANPHENIQEIVVQPGSKIVIRNNPAQVHSDDSHYMVQAAAQLYPGRHLQSLNARELSQVAQLAARLKHAPRQNIYFGFGPAPSSEPRLTLYRRPRGVRSSRQHPGGSSSAGSALRADVASALVNQGYKPAQAKRMAREASGTDFPSLFNDALRQNPMCGAMVQGYACTRKPGHKGPHLPQGATMRTRHRLPKRWQPNPSAEALREKFTGAPVEHVRVMDEPHMPAGNYAMLGKLLSLYVKPLKGGQVQEIRAAGGTMVVSDESARQIYFVGGDQDISSGLQIFGALDRGAGLFELGEARRIDYKQRKEHVDHPEQDSWRHSFGEENNIHPTVLFDTKLKRLLLEGGDYRIEEAGIIN